MHAALCWLQRTHQQVTAQQHDSVPRASLTFERSGAPSLRFFELCVSESWR
jgi:hypothetical protein